MPRKPVARTPARRSRRNPAYSEADYASALAGDANLEGANLERANLQGANLEGVDLTDANLEGANLYEANLYGANLYGANLTSANLADADLVGASLYGANLSVANLRNADLRNADLQDANLEDAYLTNANLSGANLTDANLERANLTGANFTGANVEGTILEKPPVTRPARSFGRQTGAVLKMGKPDAPAKAAEFKRRYPAEAERLKGDTQGRDFSESLRASVRQKYETPFSWLVTEGEYKSGMQRLCPDPNLVYKFNLDLTDPSFTERQREFLKKLADTSRQSGHPYEKKNLFTVGWVRLCVNDSQQTWLVEEIQSDVGIVRTKLKDGTAPAGLEGYADVIVELRPYIDRFYEDALGIVFMEAEKKGYGVEMLEYEAKKAFKSPRAVYEDLPRSMGMQKRPKSAVLGEEVAETWFYKPNPRKRRCSTITRDVRSARSARRNPSYLERALAGDKNLKGADLRRADLGEANLSGANLEGAKLLLVNLKEADLEGANLERANLMGANLMGANLEGANLAGANLAGANLEGAHLRDANLAGSDLSGANLSGANLEGANLTDADLSGANLRRANLIDADLTSAKLTYADLERANLKGANLKGANLYGANLKDANLGGANLEDANVQGANLEGAYLESANLRGANVSGANLYRADLRGADLRGSYIIGAHFADANLAGANLAGANLTEVDFTNANLEGANLEGAQVEGANFTGANLKNTVLGDPVTREARAYGRQTGAVLKMGKPDAPSRAAEFKRRYPAEFDRLKTDTQGRDFSESLRASVRQKYETPFSWLVTEGEYKSGTQRRCPDPNLVYKFNIRLTDPSFTQRQREFLTRLAEISRKSGHPYERGSFFTVGWVRLCVNDAERTLLVEEVQSDVGIVRTKLKDGSAPAGLEGYEDVIRDLQPYLDRFYEDALGIVFIEAEKKGYGVEMLEYEAKKAFKSPRGIYEDLPRSMGMQKRPKSAVLGEEVAETWFYKPNPRKRR